MRAQSSIEFLFCTGLAMAVMVIAMLFYYQAQSEAAVLGEYVESQRICHEIAMQISAIVSAGSGTQAALHRPQALAGQNYTVLVAPENHSVVVEFGRQTASCMLATTNVSNGTHSSFYISQDTLIRNEDGGVVVG